MKRKVLILTSSFRKHGNSNMLAESFEKGAEEAGHTVETIHLAELEIGYCRGCLACLETQHCMIKDDANRIVEKMKLADIIVFATPVYYYSISGQLKTMLDRSNPLYTSNYQFHGIYLLASAAEQEHSAVDGAVTAIEGWVACYEKAKLMKSIFAGGVDGVGDIVGHPALQEAYETGKQL